MTWKTKYIIKYLGSEKEIIKPEDINKVDLNSITYKIVLINNNFKEGSITVILSKELKPYAADIIKRILEQFKD